MFVSFIRGSRDEFGTQNILHPGDLSLGIFCCFQSLSRVCLFATLWTAACQASLSFTNEPKNEYLDTLNFPFEGRIIATFPM